MLQSSDNEVRVILFVKQGCLSKWLSPHKKEKKGQHRGLREPWEIEMASALVKVVLCNDVELLVFCWQEQHDESKLERGAGGRIKELEDPAVMVDEFAPVGGMMKGATIAAAERLYKRYDAALREEEEVSDIRCI